MSDYVNFGDVARKQCDEQAQYASRCIDGRCSSPNLGHDLRFEGDPSDYHRVKIHKDDVKEFVRRYKAYRDGSLKQELLQRLNQIYSLKPTNQILVVEAEWICHSLRAMGVGTQDARGYARYMDQIIKNCK